MKNITGKTKVIALIGNPVEHSVSPFIHNKISEHYDKDYVYVTYNILKDDLKNAILGIKALNIKGFNVTVPYKQDVIKHLDYLDETADVIGSVNTVSIENGKLIGYNTDCLGFAKSLEENNVYVFDKNICIIGAGGAARAVVYAIAKMNPKGIYIFNRNEEKGKMLANYMNNKIQTDVCMSYGIDEIKNLDKAVKFDVFVNCTTVGMYPNIDNLPLDVELINDLAKREGIVFYDLIYNPEKTKFLEQGEKNNFKIVNGLDMLIWQGVYAYEKWTDIKIDKQLVKNIKYKLKIE